METSECVENRSQGVRDETQLRQEVADSYARWFLPISISAAEAAQLAATDSDLPTWTGSNGSRLIFMPTPPPVSRDPHARPDRLGATNRRLKELRALTHGEKEAVARRVIETLMTSTDKLAVAFSGGRDSLVALHLTLSIRPDTPVVFNNTGIEFPETVAYIRELASSWGFDLHELRVKRNFWTLARERGIPVGGRGNGYFLKDLAEAADVKLSNACCNQLKITPARQHYRETGTEGVVTGLRTDESLMRRLNFADYGAIRWSRDYGALVAWPLYVWNRDDIMDYVAQHNLPLNPIYEMGHDRVGCWACLQDFFRDDSRLFVLKRTHPRMYETLKKQFGDDLLRVLAAWTDLPDATFTMDEFDTIYTPCGLDLLRPPSGSRSREKSPTDNADDEGSRGSSPQA